MITHWGNMAGQGLESRQSEFMLSAHTSVCAVVLAELLSILEFLLGSGMFRLRCE